MRRWGGEVMRGVEEIKMERKRGAEEEEHPASASPAFVLFGGKMDESLRSPLSLSLLEIIIILWTMVYGWRGPYFSLYCTTVLVLVLV